MLELRTRTSKRLSHESGQGLVELMISLTILAIAIAAVISLMTSGEITLQRSEQKGTATVLADNQLELYRTGDYADIRLDHVVLAAVSLTSAYATAHATDSNIPALAACTASSGAAGTGTPSGCLVNDSVAGENPCTGMASTDTAACLPVQTLSGAQTPDHRQYEIDTYITYSTPTNASISTTGRQIKQVLVVVRDPQRSGDPILAESGSSFDQSAAATA